MCGWRLRGRRRLCAAWTIALALLVAAALAPAASANQLSLFRRGVWVWYVSNSGGVNSIISTAHRYGVKTVYIKSGDGGGSWSQFNAGTVSRLHSAGLHVCAWQYIYPGSASAEAGVGATSVKAGADCLMIDAESEWEASGGGLGHYVEAQTYIRKLRKLIGGSFPVGLAGFPYVDYHPSFPYSVFLGPGGAQYNEPQMYWNAIGVSPDTLYSHTFTYNRPYGRTIVDLGDLATSDGSYSSNDIYRFRQLSKAYGSPGVAYWEWSQIPGWAWRALSRSIHWLRNYRPDQSWATLGQGDQSDLVVWAQEHLYSAGQHITIDGNFGSHTQRAVQNFQRAHGLNPDGVIGASTWKALLRYPAANVTWTSSGAHTARDGNSLVLPLPKSARLHAKRYEIPPHMGAG